MAIVADVLRCLAIFAIWAADVAGGSLQEITVFAGRAVRVRGVQAGRAIGDAGLAGEVSGSLPIPGGADKHARRRLKQLARDAGGTGGG